MGDYNTFFRRMTSGWDPHEWQARLAVESRCTDRLIRIPTGFGKTLGIFGAWLWNRVESSREDWPRRLVWCLPMRVLVEQTEFEIRKALEALGMLSHAGDSDGEIGVYTVMGGVDAGEWHLYPERCAVLIGTQDMLLSRALNRGYLSPRARWPMEFGLLNQDCLWVLDEVQLMDVGLATSAQLQAFRNEDENTRSLPRPCRSWWVSATLQEDWFKRSPETSAWLKDLPQVRIAARDRKGHLWDDVKKDLRVRPCASIKEAARQVAENHRQRGGTTLVVLNTVERAQDLFAALMKDAQLKKNGTDIRLVHSRFRPNERRRWREEFLNREASEGRTDRIIVATQVVEAGVDISAATLITELAPWASLVQRLGRSARWGGEAQVVVLDVLDGRNEKEREKAARPYRPEDLEASREAIGRLEAVGLSPQELERFEESEENHDLLPRLYPYEASQLLLRRELEELFDTTPDLSGADIDISRFIRSGEERDLHVFWEAIPPGSDPEPTTRPSREALCAVPFLAAREWLCGKESKQNKAPNLKKGMRAWVWDWLDGRWRKAGRRDLYPGQTVLVDAACGGYDLAAGWSPEHHDPVLPVVAAEAPPGEASDSRQDDETLSFYPWQTIGTHGRRTGEIARRLAEKLIPPKTHLFDLAGRWHDAGKAHPAFQASIVSENRPQRNDIAKAPENAWLPPSRLYPAPDGPRRAGLRHEIASVLALLEVLKRRAPDHPALLGPWKELLEGAGMTPEIASPPAEPPSPIEEEVLALDAESFNLAAYLVCAHHGKVRLAWHACPADQEAYDPLTRIRGLRDGDLLPSMKLAAADGSLHALPPTKVDLIPAAAGLNPRTGPGWTERALGLLERHGPFAVAWLEALIRAADQRASRLDLPDDELREGS
ncbi:MAG: helicase-related protein [Desulfobacterales bacterium]